MVVVDLTGKHGHFIPIQPSYSNCIWLCITLLHILNAHRLLLSVLSDWEFVSPPPARSFMHKHVCFGNQSRKHPLPTIPQTDGQTECVNQEREAILTVFVNEGRIDWAWNAAYGWVCAIQQIMSTPPCDTHHSLSNNRVTSSHWVQTCAIAHQGWSSFSEFWNRWRTPSAKHRAYTLQSPGWYGKQYVYHVTCLPQHLQAGDKVFRMLPLHTTCPQRSYCIVSFVPSQLFIPVWDSSCRLLSTPPSMARIHPVFHVSSSSVPKKIQSATVLPTTALTVIGG